MQYRYDVQRVISIIRKHGLISSLTIIYGKALQGLRLLLLKVIFPVKQHPAALKVYLPVISPIKIAARHIEVTLLSSIDVDSNRQASENLIDVTLKATKYAINHRVDELDSRINNAKDKGIPEIIDLVKSGYSPNIFPGEHYRLLAGLSHILNAGIAVEIGTFWGLGTLALKQGLKLGGKVYTYDVTPWDQFNASVLLPADFESGITQVIGDLQDHAFFASQKNIFESADIIFMDAAKDGVMERVFLKYFEECHFKKGAVLVIDDIHLWNMLDIWKDIHLPKLDISGMGHYTGTGIVELSSGTQDQS